MSYRYCIFATVTMIAMTFSAAAKPLKVFILVGQSNMEGHAEVRTFEAVGMDPETAPMLKDMTGKDGKPVVLDDVYISYMTATGGWGKKPKPLEKKGKLTVAFGAQGRGPKIGPEYTFSIYMRKHLNEPFLIIKTAWGGKSLNTDFRSPSAGPYEWHQKVAANVNDEQRAQKKEATGKYYRMMLDYVKKVLDDPGKHHPSYNKKDGYEIAGFVWFQGFNDMVDRGTYPNRTQPDGYALYTKLMAHFIRDVRKDLKVPKMPFVIGVMGVDGVPTKEKQAKLQKRYQGIAPAIRKAMAAPAAMAEFKGNVTAVQTDQYWDEKLNELATRMWKVVDAKERAAVKARADAGKPKLTREEQKALRKKIEDEAFTEKEKEYLKKGRSNKGYHYLGSAKIIGQIGKAFADALNELMQN